MLRIVSLLNWLQAIFLFIGCAWFALMSAGTNAGGFGLLVALGGLLLALPFAYLGAVLEKGRGRGLQTALSVLAFFAFPVGTLFSVFSLYAIWFSPLSARFEGRGAPQRSRRRDRSERVDELLDEVDADLIDDDWPEDEPAYAYARRMADAGLRAGALRARLANGGVSPDDIETLLGAVGLVRPGAQRARPAAREGRPARKPARPAPRRK
ncbi:MAG: hypothetical protein IT380_01805 [Myxococcales bacterium]|nr:hypothetical protein [Myxococcales bacterium]